MKNNIFDQFYTNPNVTDDLIKKIFKHFPSLKTYQFIEPSAGCGNFVFSLHKFGISLRQIKAYDLHPYQCKFVEKADYLNLSFKFKQKRLIIGNPPFGSRGKLALKFLNKGLSECPIVAMIFPKIFQRYSLQKQINKKAKLIYEYDLPANSFLVDNKEYSVNCVFQIWTLPSYQTYLNDQRLYKQKPIASADFKAFIHNNTSETIKYFDRNKYRWNFAVYRQGYYDYSKKFYSAKSMVRNRQYLFIKYTKEIAKDIFKKINFVKLSNSNTAVKGFSLTDLITEYDYQKQLFLFNKFYVSKEVKNI